MRLDVYLTENGFAESRNRAQVMIKNNSVTVGGVAVNKPSFIVPDGAAVACAKTERFVGRGGLKLEAALEGFGIDVSGMTAADIGSSTGGFTDCLLRRGAKRVFAVDCGTGQLHPALRDDGRVVLFENTNARYLTEETLGGRVDIVVMDVSFISQIKLYPAVCSILKDKSIFISLIKPQFEAGLGNIGKNGIVKNEKVRRAVIENIRSAAALYGFECRGIIDSHVTGGDGNIEYLAYFIYTGSNKTEGNDNEVCGSENEI